MRVWIGSGPTDPNPTAPITLSVMSTDWGKADLPPNAFEDGKSQDLCWKMWDCYRVVGSVRAGTGGVGAALSRWSWKAQRRHSRMVN